MKTFLPLFAGLALWFGIAVMVGVTFERAPVVTPRLQQPGLPSDGTVLKSAPIERAKFSRGLLHAAW